MGAVCRQEVSISQGVVVLQKETEEKFSIWKRKKGCQGKNLVREGFKAVWMNSFSWIVLFRHFDKTKFFHLLIGVGIRDWFATDQIQVLDETESDPSITGDQWELSLWLVPWWWGLLSGRLWGAALEEHRDRRWGCEGHSDRGSVQRKGLCRL